MIFYKYFFLFCSSFFFCQKERLNTKLKTEKELLNKVEVEVNTLTWSVREVTKRHLKSRSSHRSCSVRKADHRNLTKFTGKHLCWSLFFNKVAGLRPAILSKKRLWHRCFSVNFAKFPRTPFLQNTSGQLLLKKEKNSAILR